MKTQTQRDALTAVLGQPEHELDESKRPLAGPVTVGPGRKEWGESIVREAGGQVTDDLTTATSLVWLGGTPSSLHAILAQHPNIRWVQLPMSGVDSFREVLRDFGSSVIFTSAKGAFSQPVAEHALMLALALLRALPERLRAKTWGEPRGETLYGATVLIVGAGGIAVELARLTKPFSVNVIAVRRRDEPMPGAARTVTFDHLDDVLPEADVVVIAAALTKETYQLFTADQFQKMKSSAILINVARGTLLKTDDLVAALETGAIAGAGLDVTDPEPLPEDSPLWLSDRCVITPHSGDPAAMVAPLLRHRILENVDAFINKGRFVGLVDPEKGY